MKFFTTSFVKSQKDTTCLTPILTRSVFLLAVFASLGLSLLLTTYYLLPTASAQGVSIGVPPAPVQYTLTPEIPGPNTSVTIKVAGVGNFIGNSTITWTLDGKVADEGIGHNTFSFRTNRLGNKTTVTVSIRSIEHGIITNTWTFNPSLVNLVWEAQTTVPPLYMGHTRYSAGSRVTVFAFPEVMQGGVRVPESKLSFQWKLGDQAKPDASGLGRSSFTFVGDQLHSYEDVSVDILSGTTVVAHADITIPASTPEIILYARDPLRGILYNTALPATHTMSSVETTVHAEPYYFSRASARSGSLTWDWTLNSNPTSGPNTGVGELTLRTTSAGQGSAVVGVSLQNTSANAFLQAAQNSITVIFGQKKSSVFGL